MATAEAEQQEALGAGAMSWGRLPEEGVGSLQGAGFGGEYSRFHHLVSIKRPPVPQTRGSDSHKTTGSCTKEHFPLTGCLWTII